MKPRGPYFVAEFFRRQQKRPTSNIMQQTNSFWLNKYRYTAAIFSENKFSFNSSLDVG